jgi:arylsulfatase A-like enzyme
MGTRTRAALLFLCGLSLTAGSGCRRTPAPKGRLILVSLDTLRADHLGAYGYRRSTSPFLDSLAARGTLFENAIAQLPGTLPSHMSIFTGLYPAEHGVYPPESVLAPQIRTLPEVLQAHGFRTGGHVEGGYVAGRYGFARGFGEWSEDSPIEEGDGTPRHSPEAVKRTFRRGLEFLKGVRKSESFFLFLHTYSVHDPYEPPEPYRSLYWKGPPPPGAFPPIGTELLAVNEGRRDLPPGARDYYEALYDAQINYTDDVLRDFFAGVADLGLADVTVIVTSDHGEEFLEHGMLVHQQVYQETVHIPLIVVGAGSGQGRRVPTLVQSIDIAPTLYELARIPLAVRPRFSGRSLAPLLTGGSEASGREAYAEGFVSRDRALFRQAGGSFEKLVVVEPRGDEAGAWISRSVSFETDAPRLRLWVESYHRPREMTVHVGGARLATHRLAVAGRWLEIELPPSEGERRVELRSPGCTVPKEVGEGTDTRCLSFRVKGHELQRRELYDLSADPRETRDLARERKGSARELFRRLQDYRWKPLAAPGSRPLDPEAEEELRALGYVR